MKKQFCSAVLILTWMTGQAFAWDTSRNPDRYTELGLQVSGAEDTGADFSSTHKSVTQEAGQNSSNIAPLGELLVPLSNRWSVRTSLGGSFTHSDRDQTGTLDATDTNSKSLDYTASLRYFFLDRHLTSYDISQNPDEWPLVTLGFSGSRRVGYDISNTFNGVENGAEDSDLNDGFSHTYGVTSGVRLPTSNHWSWNVNLGANFNDSGDPGSATIAQTETKTQVITASAGPKYYFVGHNLIRQDDGKNPDRWISIATTANGAISAHGDQDNTLNGVETDRSDSTHSIGFSNELRIPVANALTLRLGLSGTWAYSSVPTAGTYNANNSYTPSLTGLVGFRYFFE